MRIVLKEGEWDHERKSLIKIVEFDERGRVEFKKSLVKKEGLHQKQKCLKRNVLKERAELKRKSLIDGRVVLNRRWALFLFKRNNFILTGRALLNKKILNTVNLSGTRYFASKQAR